MKSIYLVLITATFSKFIDDIGHQRRCMKPETLEQPSKLFPGIDQCHPQGPYYSPLSVICSEKCLDITQKASKVMKDGCNTNVPKIPDASFGASRHVYSLWSDAKSNSIVCAKGRDNDFCLKELYNYQFKKYDPTFLVPEKECTPCMKNIHTQFKNNPYDIPQVHTSPVYDPVEVIKLLGQLCNWS